MSARFDNDLYQEILEYAKEKGIPKTRALRELTKEGVKKWKLTKAEVTNIVNNMLKKGFYLSSEAYARFLYLLNKAHE